jgi:hypothetical protein
MAHDTQANNRGSNRFYSKTKLLFSVKTVGCDHEVLLTMLSSWMRPVSQPRQAFPPSIPLIHLVSPITTRSTNKTTGSPKCCRQVRGVGYHGLYFKKQERGDIQVHSVRPVDGFLALKPKLQYVSLCTAFDFLFGQPTL